MIAAPVSPLVSVVVPVYNEGSAISRTIEQLSTVLRSMENRFSGEIVVVDDGSTDESVFALRIFAREGVIRLVSHEHNRGSGMAIATGFAAARGSIIVAFDADLSYEAPFIETLVDRLLLSRAEVALASPYAKGGRVTNVPFLRAWCSRWANRVLCLASGNAARTFTCMVRAYDAQALGRWQYGHVSGEFNAALLIRALRSGARIVEVPAHLCWPGERRKGIRRSTHRLTNRTLEVLVSACSLVAQRSFLR
jgi:glycosyltransferase involved in cell wall biosynthesis